MSILKEGCPFIIPPFAAGLALIIVPQLIGANITFAVFCLLQGGGAFLLLLGCFCLFFFRDPRIKITGGENIILSPCNGTVLEVTEEENENIIRVFLSIFNVHLQRSPVSGTVTGVEHRKGKFLMAMNPQAHSVNEQNIISIKNEDGLVIVRQIAGFLARRCVSRVKAGDTLKAGDKIGLIKFSSQVDLHLPKTIAIKVHTGEKVRAGITVVGEK